MKAMKAMKAKTKVLSLCVAAASYSHAMSSHAAPCATQGSNAYGGPLEITVKAGTTIGDVENFFKDPGNVRNFAEQA